MRPLKLARCVYHSVSLVSINPHHPQAPHSSSFVSLLHTLYLPKFGFNFPARIFNAVDFPIPLVPTRPRTSPGRGMGRRCNLNEFALYRWVVSFSRLLGRLMIEIASKGHFFQLNEKKNEKKKGLKSRGVSRPRPLPSHRYRSRYTAVLKLQPSCQWVSPLYTASLKKATHSNAFVNVLYSTSTYPFLRRDKTACTLGDISWACSDRGSLWQSWLVCLDSPYLGRKEPRGTQERRNSIRTGFTDTTWRAYPSQLWQSY